MERNKGLGLCLTYSTSGQSVHESVLVETEQGPISHNGLPISHMTYFVRKHHDNVLFIMKSAKRYLQDVFLLLAQYKNNSIVNIGFYHDTVMGTSLRFNLGATLKKGRGDKLLKLLNISSVVCVCEVKCQQNLTIRQLIQPLAGVSK